MQSTVFIEKINNQTANYWILIFKFASLVEIELVEGGASSNSR